MKIIYVDDEKSSRINFHYETRNFENISSIEYFENAESALEYCKDNEFDVAFLDIELGNESGIELSKKVRAIKENVEIVFVTAHEGYALEAYKNGGRAYLVKPYSSDELLETMVLLKKLVKDTEPETHHNEDMNGRVKFRTFGRFDMYIDNSPIVFKTAKSKELMAFLIDNKGSTVTNAEVFTALWESKEYNKSTSSYVRKTVAALKELLHELNLNELVNFQRNSICIDMSLFRSGFALCDYYSILNEETTYLRDYNGYYMMQYAWAEESISVIETKIKFLAKASLFNFTN